MCTCPGHDTPNYNSKTVGREAIEEWRILASVAMLSAAAAKDLKSRSVSDWLWIAFGALAAALYAVDFSPADRLPAVAVSMAVTSALSFAVYRSWLFGEKQMPLRSLCGRFSCRSTEGHSCCLALLQSCFRCLYL